MNLKEKLAKLRTKRERLGMQLLSCESAPTVAKELVSKIKEVEAEMVKIRVQIATLSRR